MPAPGFLYCLDTNACAVKPKSLANHDCWSVVLTHSCTNKHEAVLCCNLVEESAPDDLAVTTALVIRKHSKLSFPYKDALVEPTGNESRELFATFLMNELE